MDLVVPFDIAFLLLKKEAQWPGGSTQTGKSGVRTHLYPYLISRVVVVLSMAIPYLLRCHLMIREPLGETIFCKKIIYFHKATDLRITF